MILSMFEARRRMSVLFNAPPLPDPAPRVTVDLARKHRGIDRNVFFSRDNAVAWLLKYGK